MALNLLTIKMAEDYNNRISEDWKELCNLNRGIYALVNPFGSCYEVSVFTLHNLEGTLSLSAVKSMLVKKN